MIKTKNSLILITAILLLTLIITIWVYLNKPDTDKVIISVDGVVIEEISLLKDGKYYYNNNGDENIIEVKDQMVSVIYSNCANQICVNSYPLSKEYPFVICCLPHGLVIEIASNEK